MAFKKITPVSPVPDSPEKLFLELPRRKFPDVLPHQKEMMRTYASEATELRDVALQLPTGSGKTLVGLLIAEWLRRSKQERVVYLCPTRQLVNQVVEQAVDKYGLTVLGFTGSARDYNQAAKAEYRNADRVAVTTYNSLFNTNPFFNDADVLIVDDAHAAESYVASLWTFRVERTKPEHATLHTALRGVIRPTLDLLSFARLSGQLENLSDRAWVDKIPTPVFLEISDEIAEVVDAHVHASDLQYPWSMIKEHLHACHVYLSSREILIRPLIPPTWSHAPFCNPRQRIYMSATLGVGGDLERLMGRRQIVRLPTPDGWDRQGVGRRFFIFPGMSLNSEQSTTLRKELMRRARRSLVLVPSDQMRDEIADDVKENLKFQVFRADDIEESKKPFVSAQKAVAAVANRYDGIDFPGKECRLLFVEGLPKATNLQEQFLMARMGANVLFNERIQVRVLQAIGRCTRSLEDYSAVVVSGEELTDHLADRRRRGFLHPELQAEISFGVDQSKGTSLADLIENFEIFLENGEDWEQVNQQIVATRASALQRTFPAIEELRDVVKDEVKFQEQLWQSDYEAALEFADQVLANLNSEDLRGYRALWHYLAGSAAWLGSKAGVSGLSVSARTQFGRAKRAAHGIPWLVVLSRYQAEEAPSVSDNSILMEQLERVEVRLAELGTVHDRRFATREREILDGLQSKQKGQFECAHKLLGLLLGFEADNVESDGSPDPWWITGGICFVFEDHAGAQEESTLDVTKARQVNSHPNWMRQNVAASKDAAVIPVLITPVKTAKRSALANLEEVALWKLDEFRRWAAKAITVVRELRRTFVEPGDLEWRAKAAEKFEQNKLDAPGLRAMLQSLPATDHLEPVD